MLSIQLIEHGESDVSGANVLLPLDRRRGMGK